MSDSDQTPHTTLAERFHATLPTGWRRFDLSQGIRGQVRSASALMLADLGPEDAARVRKQVEDQLFSALTALAAREVELVYLPTANPLVSTSLPLFTVQPVPFPEGGEAIDPLALLGGLLEAENSSLIEPPQMVGVRTLADEIARNDQFDDLSFLRSDVAAEVRASLGQEAANWKVRQRTIDYVIGVPDAPDRWAMITAHIQGPVGPEGDELVDAITMFSDNWVHSVEWTG